MSVHSKIITTWEHSLVNSSGCECITVSGKVDGETVCITITHPSKGYADLENRGSLYITWQDWKDLLKAIGANTP